jgi:hypothetical protein
MVKLMITLCNSSNVSGKIAHIGLNVKMHRIG